LPFLIIVAQEQAQRGLSLVTEFIGTSPFRLVKQGLPNPVVASGPIAARARPAIDFTADRFPRSAAGTQLGSLFEQSMKVFGHGDSPGQQTKKPCSIGTQREGAKQFVNGPYYDTNKHYEQGGCQTRNGFL
jgi:hypothetical protein